MLAGHSERTAKGMQPQVILRATTSTARRVSDLEAYAMANVLTADTGLPMVVYISQKNAAHGPRLKVSQYMGDEMRPGEWFSMTIEDEPKRIGERGKIRPRDIGLVVEFIELNRRLLEEYWEQEPPMGTKEMLNRLQVIET